MIATLAHMLWGKACTLARPVWTQSHSTDFWTSPNVSVWHLVYFCPRLRSVLIFSRSYYASLITASWCSLNTWICSSCKLTYLKSVGETWSLEDISKSKALKSWEVPKVFFFFKWKDWTQHISSFFKVLTWSRCFLLCPTFSGFFSVAIGVQSIDLTFLWISYH